ncbi:MAG: hypothetical protein F6J87_19355 [Spirulina sp. SIO3F2]|nr:hypothetical protein [Spirulina sp. SIO3F2]
MQFNQQRIILVLICVLFGLSLAQYAPTLLNNLPQSQPIDQRATFKELYATKPNLKTCQAGQLNSAEKTNILNHINYIRGLHGLLPLLPDQTGDRTIDEAALRYAANGDSPDSSKPCPSGTTEEFTAGTVGYQVYQSSVGTAPSVARLPTSESMISSLIQDHRRGFESTITLLNPFAERVQIGRADGATDYRRTENLTREGEETEDSIFFTSNLLLHFLEPETIVTANAPEFLAYPYENYPAQLFRKGGAQVGYPHLIFWLPNYEIPVDLSQAQVTIESLAGDRVFAQNLDFSTEPTTLGYYLAWTVEQLELETRYAVTISNVLVNQQPKEYTYWFLLEKN